MKKFNALFLLMVLISVTVFGMENDENAKNPIGSEWSIANSDIASNDGNGMYTATEEGATTISVMYKGLSASAELIVE